MMDDSHKGSEAGVASTNGTYSHDAQDGRRLVYLITGSNRGLGKGLVAALLQQANTTVIAATRNRTSTTANDLSQLPKADGSKLILAKIDSSDPKSPELAAEELHAQRLTHIDVVIANAAIAENYGPTSTMQLEHLQNHMMVNAYSVLLLFQAMKPFLQKAPRNSAQFLLVGAPISTITEMEGVARAPLGAYRVSKLAACYLVRKLHFENPWLLAYVVDRGHGQTDMGNMGARLLGRNEAPTTVEASVEGVRAKIREATKEKTSGQFVLWEDGSRVAW